MPILGIQLEKLTSNRIYLDFNATSPFSSSVKKWLEKGDFSFANPSSIHQSGRVARKKIVEVKAFLLNEFFSTNSNQQFNNQFDLYFHSGATEGVNSLVKGLAMKAKAEKTPFYFYYFESDHSSVVSQKIFLEEMGGPKLGAISLPVNKNGEFDLPTVVKLIKKKKGTKLLNFTWSHNETGVVWDLSLAEQIKKESGCLIHVDSVQSVGKIKNWTFLNPFLDYYSYSGHKFGSLKGVGFTFIKSGSPFYPLIEGGGQQEGKRAGTENALGIATLKLALEDLKINFDFDRLEEGRIAFEKLLTENLGSNIEIIGKDAKVRNGNTIFFLFKKGKVDLIIADLDLNGIDVGVGAACSSGVNASNRILCSMGYSEELSKKAIRLSFSPFFSKEKASEYFPVFLNLVKKHL